LEGGLNTRATLPGMDDGGDLDQEAVPDSFDDPAVMPTHGRADDLIMPLQQPQHARFINPHLAAEAHDVGEHDGSQLTSLSESRTGAVLWPDGDYRGRSGRLSHGRSLDVSLPWRAPRSEEGPCAARVVAVRIILSTDQRAE